MGNMFDKLPFKDELQSWIATYGSYSNVNSYEEPASLDYLMRYWEKAKSNSLYKMLGENFIIEKEVSFNRPDSEIEEILKNDNSDIDYFVDNYIDWVRDIDEDGIVKRRLLKLSDLETLATNEYTGHSFKININGTSISIQTGCKPSKILGKIANAANIEGFEKFRIAHSMALDKKHSTGTLCVSIHPLDYLTMSDNEYDWDSCMNWRNAGCYRMGTVEMMNSPYVVVVYLKGSKTMRYYTHKWNSKKWRNLFIVTPECIMGIKGYPYQSAELDGAALDMLKDLAEINLGYRYLDKIYSHHFYENCDDVELEDDECEYHTIHFEFETGYMYNDFGNSNTTHFLLSPDVFKNELNISCDYSGFSECMYCGHEIDGWDYDIADADEVICTKYINPIECCCCGCAVSEEFELDGDYYCEDCYYENRAFDPFGGEYHHRDNMKEIYLVPSREEFEQNKESDEYISNCPKFNIYSFYDFEHWNSENNTIYSFECTKENTYWRYEYLKRYNYVIESELSKETLDVIIDLINGDYD